MFDLEKFLTTSPIEVNATNIRFRDSRTGEIFNRTIFRPGKTITFQTLGKELAHYGYILLWVDDTPGNIPGRMNWSDVFGKFIQEEGAND